MRTTILSLLLVSACGTDAAAPPPGPGSGSGSGTPPLISYDWSLSPSQEQFLCVRQTVTEDMWITQIAPIAPTGTHHMIIKAGAPDGPDGMTPCTGAGMNPTIYASAVGTQPLDFPDGIALHIAAGQQILLNLHLFNASDNPISGTSGVTVTTTADGTGLKPAGVVLAGKTTGLTIAAGPGNSEQTGTCTTPAGFTVFAVAPHMHLLGTKLTATYAPPSGAPTTLIDDETYSFDNQSFSILSTEMPTVANGKVHVTCDYYNPSSNVVTFGESTTDEMCFAMMYVYPPPPPAQFICTK